MEYEIIKTADKKIAMALLERCLDLGQLVNARIENLNGVYIVEVSQPTDEGEPSTV